MADVSAVATAVATNPVATPPSGRLAMLAVMAVASSAIPVPFVPDRVLKSIRGAVVQDVAARHGLSLTSDARALLAVPGSGSRSTHLARKAIEVVAGQVLKRFGPFGAVGAMTRAIEVYALGHLADRYVTRVRVAGPIRIHGDEARLLRDLVDRAVVKAMSPSLALAASATGETPEDLRDEFTRWIDTILLTGAAVPGYVERRLESAFDAVAEQSEGA